MLCSWDCYLRSDLIGGRGQWATGTLGAAAVAAVFIVATPPGRVHPPTACIPLAITPQAIQPLALLGRWLSFTGLAAACLAALWLLTVQPLSRLVAPPLRTRKDHAPQGRNDRRDGS